MTRPIVDSYGIKHKSITDAARYYHKSFSTIYERLTRNVPLDAEVMMPSKRHMKRFEYKGKVFNSIKQAYEYFGLTRAGFYYRVLHNVPLELKRNSNMISVTYNNKTYKSLVELYNDNKEHLQITYCCLARRLRDGMTVEEALSDGKFSCTVCRDSKGNVFKSIKDAAKYHHVHYKTVQARLNDGIPLEGFRKYKNKLRIN